MDTKDLKILRELEKNSKLSTYKISKKTAIPITTVHHRIKKLEKEGIIKQYSLILDKNKIGRSISAYVLVKMNRDLLRAKSIPLSKMVEGIKKMYEVEEVSLTTGQHDLMLRVGVKDIDGLHNFLMHKITKIEGVAETETMIIIKSIEKRGFL